MLLRRSNSLHHARELNTIEVTLDAIRWLTTRYGSDSRVTYLTEIGTDFQPPFDDTRAEVERVRPGWQMLLDAPSVGPLVQGHVRDAATAEPIAAKLDSDLVPFTEGERRASEPVFGRFRWLLIPGLHELDRISLA